MKGLTKISLIVLGLLLIFTAGALAANTVPNIFVNSNEVASELSPRIIDGHVYVPIRAVAEGFGAPIRWDNDTKTVYINSEPDAVNEPSRLSWVLSKNTVEKFIMAYDERDLDSVNGLISDQFTTNLYDAGGFPSVGIEANSIIDFRMISYDGGSKFTYEMIKRNHPAIEDGVVKVEQWEFDIEYRINSVQVKPDATHYLDQYTVVPNATFGVGY